MILDVSAEGQTYIEDCEVCCNPVQIGYSVGNGELSEFWAEAIEQ